MVSLRSLTVATLASMTPLTSALIGRMIGPETGVAGESVTATIVSASYPQNVEEFGIVWGLYPAAYGSCGDIACVGVRVDYTAIFPDQLALGNTTVDVPIPADTAAGDYSLVAAVPRLIGASGEITVGSFSSNITITAA